MVGEGQRERKNVEIRKERQRILMMQQKTADFHRGSKKNHDTHTGVSQNYWPPAPRAPFESRRDFGNNRDHFCSLIVGNTWGNVFRVGFCDSNGALGAKNFGEHRVSYLM